MMPNLEVLHVNSADTGGGAARAAQRLHLALRAAGVDSMMLVRHAGSGAPGVFGPRSRIEATLNPLRCYAGRALMRLQSSGFRTPRSGNFLPSRWSRRIDLVGPDVVNLHWLGAETMSIEDIGRIRRPIVWTFHDMWAFCGAEHVEPDASRWAPGYLRENRSIGDTGLDIDRWVWTRKKNAWQQPMRIIVPSRWMADCVGRSALMAGKPVAIIPNVLDTECFRPHDRAECRRILGLPQDRKLVLFGAIQSATDVNKGYDLLSAALGKLAVQAQAGKFECVVFGQTAPASGPIPAIKTHWLGHIDCETTLAQIYSAADVMVVPSRVENLPQTATEAQSCACPVVAFRTCGLPDAVDDRITGYLAEPYDPEDLARGISWVTADRVRHQSLGIAARSRAERLWSAYIVLPKYQAEYRLAIEAGLQHSAIHTSANDGQ